MAPRKTPRLRLERLDDRDTPAGLDPTFAAGGVATLDLSPGPSDLAMATAVAPDGTLYTLGSSFSDAALKNQLTLTRLNPDGSPDAAFGTNGTLVLPLDGGYAGVTFLGRTGSGQLAVAPDGKVVVAAPGYQTRAGAPGAFTMVARLNPDGTPDATFDGDGVATVALPGDGQAFTWLSVLADGSVVLAGPETVSQGEVSVFPPPGYVVPQPNEVVLAKLTAAGAADAAFGTNGVVRLATPDRIPTDARVAVLPDGRLLVYGEELAPEGQSPLGPFYIPGRRVFAARLTAAGATDATYGQGGWFEAALEAGADSAGLLGGGVAVDGSLYAVTAQVRVNADPATQTPRPAYLFRVTPTGQFDSAYAGDGRFEIDAPYFLLNGRATFSGAGVLPRADGSVYVVAEGRVGVPGGPATALGETAFVVERLTPAGALDPTYGTNGLVVVRQSELGPDPVVAFDAAADAQGRVLLTGRTATFAGDGKGVVFRIAPDAPTAPLPPAPGGGGPAVDVPAAPPVFGRTIAADVNGDGTPDAVSFSAAGGASIAATDGRTGTVLVSDFRPYEATFRGGLAVVAADLDGDGRDELIVAPDVGGSARVQVLAFADGRLVVRDNFFAFDDPNFRGGARLAAGDFDGDGTPDLAVAAGPTGGPRVGLFDGAGLLAGGVPARLANDFFAFGGPDAATLRDGAYVAAGDLDGDGRAELVFGAGPGGAPRVVVIDPATGVAPVATFFTLGDTESRAGAPVTVDDRDGDGRPEVYAMNPARGLVCVYRDPATLAAAGTPYDQVYVPLPRPVEIPPAPLVS